MSFQGSTIVCCEGKQTRVPFNHVGTEIFHTNNVHYTGRLVATGLNHKQVANDTFSSVVRHYILRMLFDLSVQLHLNTHADVFQW